MHIRRPTPATVIALVALAISVGGTGYAAVRITSPGQLGPGVVTSPKLAHGSVTSRAVAPGAVGEAALAPGSVSRGKLRDYAVSASKIANGAVPQRSLQHPVYFVVVSQGRDYVRGMTTSVTHGTPSNRTIVRFGIDVSHCGLAASVASATTTQPPAAGIALAFLTGEPGEVGVDTLTPAGAAAQRPFTLIVAC